MSASGQQVSIRKGVSYMVSHRSHKLDTVSSVYVSLFLVGVILCSSFLVGCGDPHKKPQYQWETAVIVPYRMPEVIANCTDRTSSYPTNYAREELNALASGLLHVASLPNRGDLWLFINTISSSSLTTGLPPIHLDHVNADNPGPPPLVLPQQQPHENPYEYATKVAQLKKAYQQKIDQYQASLRKNHTQLREMQKIASQDATSINTISLASDKKSGTDLLSCITGSAEIFALHPGYKHVLLIASDMVENRWKAQPSNLDLHGTVVTVAWFYCGDSPQTCANRQAYWTSFFNHFGAKAMFYDRVNSLALEDQNELF